MSYQKAEIAAFSRALAEVVRKRRQELNLSLTQLGALSGLSQQSVSYLEREMRSPNIETLFRISDTLGLDLSELIRSAEKIAGTQRKHR